MKNTKLALIALVFLTAACQKKEDAPKPYTPHVAGSWAGDGTDDAIGYFNLAVDLNQSGDSAAGTFTMVGGVATVRGDIYMAIGPQGNNNLQSLTLTRRTWTVNDPANSNRVCQATLTVHPGSYAITGGATTFRYTMTDCQGGTWEGGANLHKLAGTN